MGYDVCDLLENLFSGTATTTAAAAQSVALPEPTSQPEAVDTPADPLAALSFADWVVRPDCHGRMAWEAPGLPESDRWWASGELDDLPEPSPKCGSLEAWWDLLGGQHCQHCDGDLLRRGLDLLKRAERIRGRKP